MVPSFLQWSKYNAQHGIIFGIINDTTKVVTDHITKFREITQKTGAGAWVHTEIKYDIEQKSYSGS